MTPLRHNDPRDQVRYDAQCPGCGKRQSGLSEDDRRKRILTHARNCNALKKIGALVPLGEVR